MYSTSDFVQRSNNFCRHKMMFDFWMKYNFFPLSEKVQFEKAAQFLNFTNNVPFSYVLKNAYEVNAKLIIGQKQLPWIAR